eukprot:5394090-Pleurochrysis_carterae.AAC.1
MSQNARRVALIRHTHDIAAHLEFAAADWEPSAFASALVWLDLLPSLLQTRPFVKARMEFARELADLLRLEWGVELALYVKTELALSDSNLQKARLALSHTYSAENGSWRRRVWYTEPVTGESLFLPSPLVSRYT